jgi:hypothetical protein
MRAILPILSCAFAGAMLAAAPDARAQKFTRISAESGIAAIVDQKYAASPDWWLSGLHLVDLDGDSDLDLFLSAHGGGGAVATLNDGTGKFTVAGGTHPLSEIHLYYDANEDGLVDLTMTYLDGGGQWWTNGSSAGALDFAETNVTRDTNSSRTQALFDADGDGKVDWLRSAPPGIVFDKGDGQGGFEEDTQSLAVSGTTSNSNASFIPTDLDADGDIDLVVLSGGGYDNDDGRTRIWLGDGTFAFQESSSSGLPADGTLVKGVGDFDQDGDVDLIALEAKTMPPVIYLNDGQGTFAEKPSAISGIGANDLEYAAWGTAVTTDFDNDGVADIVMNGKYFLKLLRGTGGGSFSYVNDAWDITDTSASSIDDGLCFGDIDSDGDLDLVGYTEIWPGRRFDVYRNDLPAQGWLRVRPVGLAGNKGAAGAKIRIFEPGTTNLIWFEEIRIYDFQAANSYYGHHESERHFGLGARSSVDVEVEFYPSHAFARANGAARDTTVVLREDGAAGTGGAGGTGGGSGSSSGGSSAGGAATGGSAGSSGGSAGSAVGGSGAAASGGSSQGGTSGKSSAGPDSSSDDGACGCALPGHDAGSLGAWLASGLALAALRGMRRRARGGRTISA